MNICTECTECQAYWESVNGDTICPSCRRAMMRAALGSEALVPATQPHYCRQHGVRNDGCGCE